VIVFGIIPAGIDNVKWIGHNGTAKIKINLLTYSNIFRQKVNFHPIKKGQMWLHLPFWANLQGGLKPSGG
jgi:hypothetical protein